MAPDTKHSAPEGSIRTMRGDVEEILGEKKLNTEVPPQNGVPEGKKVERTHSILTNKDDVFDVSGAFKEGYQRGTIVTDKKKKKRSLFDILRGAATEWTEDKVDAVKSTEAFQKPEVPKIAPGRKRKDILEKAVAYKEQLPRDDHKIVMERIRTFQKDAERVTGKPFQIKPKDERSEPAKWSHLIGEAEKAVEKEETVRERPARIIEEHEGVPDIRREHITPEASESGAAPHVEEKLDTPVESFLPHESSALGSPTLTDIKGDINSNVAAETDIRIEETTPSQRMDVKKPQREIPPTPEPPKPAPKPPKPVPVPKSKPVPPLEQPERTPEPEVEPGGFVMDGRIGIALVVVIIMLVALGGITGAALFFGGKSEIAAPEEILPVSFFDVEVRVAVPLVNDRDELLGNLRNTIDAHAAMLLQTYLVFPATNNSEEALATTADFFAVLEPRVRSAFVRSLDNRMMLGGIRTGEMEPYMVLKSNAFDTAFAGMLEWENFISSDLAPLFGAPVSRSFDKDARTNDHTTEQRFIDRIIDGRNVRILYDETGAERIVYGFVNRNTIIITTTGTAFSTLLSSF